MDSDGFEHPSSTNPRTPPFPRRKEGLFIPLWKAGPQLLGGLRVVNVLRKTHLLYTSFKSLPSLGQRSVRDTKHWKKRLTKFDKLY